MCLAGCHPLEIHSYATLTFAIYGTPPCPGTSHNELKQVADFRRRFPDKDIQVDGGVGPKTIKPCADAGSNVIVAGTAVFGAPQPKEVIEQLRKAVDDARPKWLKN